MCTFVTHLLSAVIKSKRVMTASVKSFDSVVHIDNGSGVRILLFLSQVVRDYLLHDLHGTSLPYQECTELVSHHRPIQLILWLMGLHMWTRLTASVMERMQSWCSSGTATTSPSPSVLYVACVCLSVKRGSDCLTQALYFILLVHTDKYDLD